MGTGHLDGLVSTSAQTKAVAVEARKVCWPDGHTWQAWGQLDSSRCVLPAYRVLGVDDGFMPVEELELALYARVGLDEDGLALRHLLAGLYEARTGDR